MYNNDNDKYNDNLRCDESALVFEKQLKTHLLSNSVNQFLSDGYTCTYYRLAACLK